MARFNAGYRKHKYNAKPTECNGIRFASKREAEWYKVFYALQVEGKVDLVLRQVPIDLPGGIRYMVDFLVFYADGTAEFVEVKGVETKEWKLKRKLVEKVVGVELRVVK